MFVPAGCIRWAFGSMSIVYVLQIVHFCHSQEAMVDTGQDCNYGRIKKWYNTLTALVVKCRYPWRLLL